MEHSGVNGIVSFRAIRFLALRQRPPRVSGVLLQTHVRTTRMGISQRNTGPDGENGMVDAVVCWFPDRVWKQQTISRCVGTILRKVLILYGGSRRRATVWQWGQEGGGGWAQNPAFQSKTTTFTNCRLLPSLCGELDPWNRAAGEAPRSWAPDESASACSERADRRSSGVSAASRTPEFLDRPDTAARSNYYSD